MRRPRHDDAGLVSFLRNPYFIAALLFFVLGVFGIAVSWFTGLILLVVAFFCAFTGITVGMLRRREGDNKQADGTIRLNQLHQD
jgi:hypothetical protein